MVPGSGMGIALIVLGRIGAGAGGQLGGLGEAANLPNRGAEVPQQMRGQLYVKVIMTDNQTND